MGNLADEVAQFHARVAGGTYDNFVDLILEARAFHGRLPPGPSHERTVIEEILTTAMTSAAELAATEPGMAEYLAEIIDPTWIRGGEVVVEMSDIDSQPIKVAAAKAKKPAAKAKAKAKAKPAAKAKAKKPAPKAKAKKPVAKKTKKR
jgi:hypothetical protein